MWSGLGRLSTASVGLTPSIARRAGVRSAQRRCCRVTRKGIFPISAPLASPIPAAGGPVRQGSERRSPSGRSGDSSRVAGSWSSRGLDRIVILKVGRLETSGRRREAVAGRMRMVRSILTITLACRAGKIKSPLPADRDRVDFRPGLFYVSTSSR